MHTCINTSRQLGMDKTRLGMISQEKPGSTAKEQEPHRQFPGQSLAATQDCGEGPELPGVTIPGAGVMRPKPRFGHQICYQQDLIARGAQRTIRRYGLLRSISMETEGKILKSAS